MRLLSVVQKISNIFVNRFSKSYGHILTFHIIYENYDNKNSDISISVQSFRSMLISLLNYGYKFKSINDLNIDSKKNDIYITFDDVHKSVYSIAYPILKELNIPFCCFITTNFIDKENYITSDMLIELSDDDLVTIGSHSVSHPLMRQSLDEDLINEFIESSDILSRITHKKTLFFAYPYGSFYAVDRRTIKMISNTDYVLAFSNVGHLLTKKDLIKKHFISRVNINESNYYKYMVKK